MTSLMIYAAIALLVMFWAVGAYRRLSRQRKQCKTAFARLDEQLRHRHALLPALSATANDHAGDARGAAEAVIAADNEVVAASAKAARSALDAAALTRLGVAEAALEAALSAMLAQAVTADNHALRQLADELNAVEGKIAFARQVYNDAAARYNASRAQFPGSVIAFVFAFTSVSLLQDATPPQRS